MAAALTVVGAVDPAGAGSTVIMPTPGRSPYVRGGGGGGSSLGRSFRADGACVSDVKPIGTAIGGAPVRVTVIVAVGSSK
jgi:hypothetical protein